MLTESEKSLTEQLKEKTDLYGETQEELITNLESLHSLQKKFDQAIEEAEIAKIEE